MIAAELKTLRLEDTYDEIETWSQDEVLAWQLDRVRAVIRDDFGLEARFTHFPIAGLCPDCAGAT